MNAADPEEIAHFDRWARRVRRAGHLLRTISYHPETLPDGIDNRVVIVANHTSLADVFLAIETLGHYGLPARCLVRAKYFKGLAGRWLEAVDCIPAGDGSGRSVDEALATLAAGRPVAVMAEGRITPPEQRDADGLGEFRTGFIDIARAAGVDILPIGVVGAERIWASRGRLPKLPWRGRPHVELHTGTLVPVADRSDEEILADTRAVLAGYLRGARAS